MLFKCYIFGTAVYKLSGYLKTASGNAGGHQSLCL